MCVVSVVSAYGQTIDSSQWTRPVFDEFKDLLKRAADLDEKLSQPDCVDPEKELWMRDVEDRLQQLEQAIID